MTYLAFEENKERKKKECMRKKCTVYKEIGSEYISCVHV